MAVLSIEAADVQVDCLHRLIAGLCAAEGGVELLCRLPWAHNLLVRAQEPALACLNADRSQWFAWQVSWAQAARGWQLV